MKKIISFLSLFCCCLASFSQQDTTTVYARRGFERDPIRSKWRPEVIKKDSVWILSLYDKKQLLKEQITYADGKLQERRGPYTAYFDDGAVKEQGNFDKGYKHGEWTYFFPNKQIMEKVSYSWGSLNGAYKAYWENGNVKKDGAYTLRKKMGNWRMYYQNGKIASNESYDDRGELISGTYFDQNGEQKTTATFIQPPTYKGGIEEFYRQLAKSIRYPVNAFKNGVQGSVKLDFIVTKEGKIEDIKVVSSPDHELSAEAIRVLKLSSGWIPGQELGETVNMKYTLPVKFTVNR